MLIAFDILLKEHSINPKGVFHVGSNNAAECEIYYANGVKRTVWVEAIPKVYKEMVEVVGRYPNAIPLLACVSDVEGVEVDFNISSNNGESSSIFEFEEHSKFHPDVTFIDKIKLKTKRLDSLIIRKGIDIRDYDFLNIDIQGNELAAMKGMGDMLRVFNFVYIEVNKISLYKGIPLFDEVDAYLKDFGFELKNIRWTGAGWGDAFYIKKQNMNSVFNRTSKQFKRQIVGITDVPFQFMPHMPFAYPSDNTLIFERYYYDNFNEPNERVYLPVQWTAYLVKHSFGNDLKAIEELQYFVDHIDRSKKYYTICQFDLGCMVDFKGLDILVFGMAGGRIDYPLPLLCMPHQFVFDNPKTLFASFIGRPTHPLRQQMIKNIRSKPSCYISEVKHDLGSYCSILSSSTFGLCPIGFGLNSFRLQESLQYGAIPVIIASSRLQPHHIPFEDYGVYIDESDAGNVYEILQNLTVNEVTQKQSVLQYYYQNYFLYPQNKAIILQNI